MVKHILLVDDDPIFHFIAKKMIGEFDKLAKISTHLNGKFAVDYIKNEFNEFDTFLVFLDINMPVMDGWEVLEELHSCQLDVHPNILIYIVSSSTGINDLEKAKKYPIVKNFYHKPLSLNDIEVILHSS